jgi:alpha-D-ribose 1-methylphosphonate 5-triphosphate diphosphatase
VTDIFIEGGRALLGRDFAETSVCIGGGDIQELGGGAAHGAVELDARDLLVLPGIVDLHGDAFERQMMPRPNVDFPIDVALVDSDRQAIANGITTVFHATTWSWEPGLRSGTNARKLIDAIEAMRPRFAADTRFHLRHETYNLDAEQEIGEWLASGRIDLFAFNDHMDGTIAALDKPNKRSRMVERTGLSNEAFDELVQRILSRADAVPASISRLARRRQGAAARQGLGPDLGGAGEGGWAFRPRHAQGRTTRRHPARGRRPADASPDRRRHRRWPSGVHDRRGPHCCLACKALRGDCGRVIFP